MVEYIGDFEGLHFDRLKMTCWPPPSVPAKVGMASSQRAAADVGSKIVNFTEAVLEQFTFLKHAEMGFYAAIQVPDDFSPPGIEMGAKVYADDSAPVQNS